MVPVLILSGFLGSGKTTLLLRLIQEAQERNLRVGILMNELGRQDIDGRIVQESFDSSIAKLLDGCVCCTRKSELAGSIGTLLADKPDLLLLELTGVANPEEVAEALTDSSLLGRVRIKQIVTVLDAEHLLDYNSVFASDRELVDTLRSQVAVADVLVLNKTDLVSSARMPKLEKAIRKLNEKAPLLPATRCAIELSPFFEGLAPAGYEKSLPVGRGRPLVRVKAAGTSVLELAQEYGSEASVRDLPRATTHSRLVTFTLEWPERVALSPTALIGFLKRWGTGLLRAKGYLPHPREGIRLLQYAGGRAEWSQVADGTPSPLVLITLDLEEADVREEWERLIATG
ncbi:GTP-binding protein [Gorillibacterium sp. CAU 1737]|uniref:CobW family GTP-binding protein n=1 Tax=Gorillibacterium sp. CAU 1737 TaxID=3140362 RepID=UPI0032605E37